MTRGRPDPRTAGRDAALDALVDAFFDGEMDAKSRESFFDTLRSDPAAARRFAETKWLIDGLRRDRETPSPDLIDEVLGEIDSRRSWLSPGARRLVSFGRLAVAASFLALLGAAFVVKREAPGALQLVEQPAPLTRVVDASRQQAADSVRTMTAAFEFVRSTAIPAPSGDDVAVLAWSGERVEAPAHRLALSPGAVRGSVFVVPSELPIELPAGIGAGSIRWVESEAGRLSVAWPASWSPPGSDCAVRPITVMRVRCPRAPEPDAPGQNTAPKTPAVARLLITPGG